MRLGNQDIWTGESSAAGHLILPAEVVALLRFGRSADGSFTCIRFFGEALLFTSREAVVQQCFNAGVQSRQIVEQSFLPIIDLVDQGPLGFGRTHTQWLAGFSRTAGASNLASVGRSLLTWLCSSWHRLFPL